MSVTGGGKEVMGMCTLYSGVLPLGHFLTLTDGIVARVKGTKCRVLRLLYNKGGARTLGQTDRPKPKGCLPSSLIWMSVVI